MLRRPRLANLTARRLYNTVPPSLLLRPARECVDACIDALSSGISSIGVFVPRGSSAFSGPSSNSGSEGAGQVKTAAILTLLSRIPPPADMPDAKRALVIVRSAARAQQAAVQAGRLFPHWTVEIDDGKAHQASGTADVTIATHRTLFDLDRLAKYDPKHLKAIVVDEAHHAASAPYRRILWRFVPAVQCVASKELVKLVRKAPALRKLRVVGFSAAFTQHSGIALRDVFPQIVCTAGFTQLIRDKWMGNARVTTVHAALAPDSVSPITNDAGVARAVNTRAMNEQIVQTWLARAAGRRTLVLCDSTHVYALTNAFCAAGVDARPVHSKMTKGERHDQSSQFKSGHFPVLVHFVGSTKISVSALPAADYVFIARPTRSPTLFSQMVSRCLRVFEKPAYVWCRQIGHGLSRYIENCHIFDFVASMPRTAGIMSTPVLFGLDPTEAIDGETIESLDARSPSVSETFPDDVPVAGADADTSFAPANYSNDLFSGDPSGAPDVRALSPNAWVGCDLDGRKVYVLDIGESYGYLYIESVAAAGSGECFVVTHTTIRVPKGLAHVLPAVADPDSETHDTGERILTADTLVDAVRGADMYAESRGNKGPIGETLLWTADWRTEPLGKAQQSVLYRVWTEKAEPHTDKNKVKLAINSLTKGEACDLIARLSFGDKGLGNVLKVSGGEGARDKKVERCDEDTRYEERERFDEDDGPEIMH